MIRPVLAVLAIVGIAGIALAQSDPIAERKALMKRNGAAAGTIAKMVKGETPFDKAKADDALQNMGEVAAKVGGLFPDDSKTGDTRANARIWEDRAGFEASLAKFGAAVEAAQSKTGSLDELRPAFGAIGATCGECHKMYRNP